MTFFSRAAEQPYFGSVLPGETGDTPVEPGPGDWPNGFAVRHRVIIPASQITTSESDVLVVVVLDVTGNTEASGDDIRFETTGGAALDYERTRYASNVAYCVVRLPSVTADTQAEFYAYVGAASPGTQQNAAGVYGQYLAVWRASGTDLTGNGRTLAATGTSITTLDNGMPALSFNGTTDVLSTAATTPWLAGLDAITVEAVAERETDGITATILLAGSGIGFGSENVTLGALASTSAGRTDAIYGLIANASESTSYVIGETDTGGVNGEEAIALRWTLGAVPAIYRDGVVQTASASRAAAGSSYVWPAAAGLSIGADWDGVIGDVRISGQALSAAKLNFQTKSVKTPAAVVGISAAYSDGDTVPVTALPMTASVTAGETVDVDIAGTAVGPGTNTLQSVTQGLRSGSSVAIIGGLARYTPGGTAAGVDYFTGTVSDGTKTSVARVDVTIAAASTPPPDPGDGTTLPTPLDTINVSNQDAFNTAMAAAVAGDHIVLANGTYNWPSSWTKSGTVDNPIVIRAANVLGARMTSSFNFDNCNNVILYGLDHAGPILYRIGQTTRSDNFKFWRCRWRDITTPDPSSIAIHVFRCDGADIAYCEWDNWGARGILLRPANGCTNPTVRRCYFHDTPPGSYVNAYEAVATGSGWADRPVYCNAVIKECLFDAYNSDDETISIKSSGNLVKQVRFINSSGRCNVRLGQYNRFEAILYAGSAGIRVHDLGNEVLGCDVSAASQGIRIAAGDFETDDVLLTSSSPSHPYAKNTYCGGNTGPLTVGAAFTGDTLPVENTTIRQHTGTPTLVPGLQTGTDSQPASPATGYSWASTLALTSADVGPNA